MRLESTTLARVLQNVKGGRAFWISLWRFSSSGFSLDFHSKCTSSFSNFDTTGALVPLDAEQCVFLI